MWHLIARETSLDENSVAIVCILHFPPVKLDDTLEMHHQLKCRQAKQESGLPSDNAQSANALGTDWLHHAEIFQQIIAQELFTSFLNGFCSHELLFLFVTNSHEIKTEMNVFSVLSNVAVIELEREKIKPCFTNAQNKNPQNVSNKCR